MTTTPRIETTMVTTRDPGNFRNSMTWDSWKSAYEWLDDFFLGKQTIFWPCFYISSQIFLTSSQCQVANAEDCSSQGVEMLLTRQWIGRKFTANHGKPRCKPWCLLSTKGISCFSWGISDHFRIFSDWPSLEQRNWHHLEQVKLRRSRGVCLGSHAIRRTMFPYPLTVACKSCSKE